MTRHISYFAESPLLERDENGEAIYMHSESCPSFCDYACNGNHGSLIAEAINLYELNRRLADIEVGKRVRFAELRKQP